MYVNFNKAVNSYITEYRPKCGGAVWLGNKGKYGAFHLWINMWVADKI